MLYAKINSVIDVAWETLPMLAGYVFVTYVTPRVLTNPRLISRFPRFTLIAWVCALCTALVLLTTGTGVLMYDGARGFIEPPLDNDWLGSVIRTLLAFGSLSVLGIILFRLGVAAGTLRVDYRSAGSALRTALLTATSEIVCERSVRVINGDEILVATTHSHGIVVSQGFVDRIPPRLQVAAIDHESAHLTQGHHTLVVAAQLALATAAGIRASARFAQAVRVATELAADDASARHNSAQVVAEALTVCYPGVPGIAERVARLEEQIA